MAYTRNELEAYFLSSLNFDVQVNASTYTKAFFHLRECTSYATMPWALEPLKMKDIAKIKQKEQRKLPDPIPIATEESESMSDNEYSQTKLLTLPKRTRSEEVITLFSPNYFLP